MRERKLMNTLLENVSSQHQGTPKGTIQQIKQTLALPLTLIRSAGFRPTVYVLLH